MPKKETEKESEQELVAKFEQRLTAALVAQTTAQTDAFTKSLAAQSKQQLEDAEKRTIPIAAGGPAPPQFSENLSPSSSVIKP